MNEWSMSKSRFSTDHKIYAAIVLFLLCAWFMFESEKDEYHKLLNECLQENVMSNFECKFAAHEMVF